jgi:hypothetical protein
MARASSFDDFEGTWAEVPFSSISDATKKWNRDGECTGVYKHKRGRL